MGVLVLSPPSSSNDRVAPKSGPKSLDTVCDLSVPRPLPSHPLVKPTPLTNALAALHGGAGLRARLPLRVRRGEAQARSAPFGTRFG